MARGRRIVEGVRKTLHESEDPSLLVLHFHDHSAAGVGVLKHRLSEFLFTGLQEAGIPSHFVRSLNMREHLVVGLDMYPFAVQVRNFASPGMAERLGIAAKTRFARPIVEFYDKKVGLLSGDHLVAMGYVNEDELEDIRKYALKVNRFLTGVFYGVGYRLMDLKLEFGRCYAGHYGDEYQILLGDDLSPDLMRLWTIQDDEIYDRARFENGGASFYQTLAKKLGILDESAVVKEEPVSSERMPSTLSSVRKLASLFKRS